MGIVWNEKSGANTRQEHIYRLKWPDLVDLDRENGTFQG